MNIKCKNPKCGRIYNSGISASNSRNITFSNVTSECPYCGTKNSIEGTYNFDKEGKPTLIAELRKLSVDNLKNVLEVSLQAQVGVIDERKFASEIGKLGINTSSILLEKSVESMGFKAFIVALIAILYMLIPKEKSIDKKLFIPNEKPKITLVDSTLVNGYKTGKIYSETETTRQAARRAMNNFNKRKNK